MRFARVDTPIGELLVVGDAAGLVRVTFEGTPEDHWKVGLATAARQLDDWFARRRTDFDLRLAAMGTPFQRKVWKAISAIPYGQTRSYGELSAQIGGSPRAVGAAAGANPLLVVVPCHRLVGADGGRVAYAAGLHRKEWLLGHEAGQGSLL